MLKLEDIVNHSKIPNLVNFIGIFLPAQGGGRYNVKLLIKWETMKGRNSVFNRMVDCDILDNMLSSKARDPRTGASSCRN